jgi:VCBS repeat-containing protein
VSVDDSFKYIADDGHGGQVGTTLTFQITGVNDTPVPVNDDQNLTDTSAIDAGTVKTFAGSVLDNDHDAENDTLSVITIRPDAQSGPTYLNGATAVAHGVYGDITINPDGTYTYTPNANYDALVDGATATDVFKYGASDGNSAHGGFLTFHITGANDAASISGTATGTVKEDGTLTAGGMLAVSDVDTGENHFQTPGTLNGNYGTFTFDANTGAWGYTLNNSASNVQALNTGDTVHDQLIVKSVDGSASQTIDVTINGTDEPAPASPLIVADTTSAAGRYALSNDSEALNAIGSNATTLFSGGAGTVSYVYSLVYSSTGDASWINRSGNQFSGNPNSGDTGLYVYKVTATDSVSSVSTYLAFEALPNNAFNLTINSPANSSSVTGSAPWLITYSNGFSDAITATVDNTHEANAGSGYDVMIGSSGGNNFNGGADDDAIYGLGGDDTLLGGANTDYINGGAGNDVITGGGGNDYLIGGSGNDTFNYGINDGNDVVDGGAGTDTLVITGSSNDILYAYLSAGVITQVNGTTLSNIEHITVDLGSDTDRLEYVTSDAVTVNLANGTATGFSSITNIENVTGGDGNDTLIGSSVANVINGGNGNDTIRGGGGNDTIDGGAGIDLLDLSDATGPLAFTLVQSSSPTNVSATGLGTDSYKNMEGVIGTNFNDVITGSSSNDILIGGKGADQLTGGGGSDTFRYRAGDADVLDTIIDFQTGSSGDVIDLSGLLASVSGNKADHVRFSYAGGSTHLASDDGNAPPAVDGTVTLQVELTSGTWTNVANIVDTGANLSAGSEVIKMMLDNSAAQTYHV